MRIEKASSTVFTPLEDGTAVLLNLDTRFYYNLNRTGTQIWRRIEENGAVHLEELVRTTCDQFDVDEEEARRYLGQFIETLEKLKLVRSA